MTAILALAGALIVGASDFGGGIVARESSEFRVTAWIQAASLATILTLVWFVDAPAVTGIDITAGVVAGLSGTFSFAALYGAFARGQISRLAPTTAIVGAAIPAVVGAARGDEVGAVQVLGIALALVAIFFVTQDTDSGDGQETPPVAFALAVLAGLGFSVFFLALAETSEEAGLWPLVVARLVSVPIAIVAALLLTRGLTLSRSGGRIASASGVAEAIANVFALLAFQRGPVPVAAVLSGFYPVSSVLLAAILLGERLQRIQWIGVGLALASVPLIAVP
ncbi:MAG: EamA family transporter [Acidimicrobiales bacterium]